MELEWNTNKSKHEIIDLFKAIKLCCEEGEKKSNINTNFETISTIDSISRISYYDIFSPINIPNNETSMMDGFAINIDDGNCNEYVILKKIYADGKETSNLENIMLNKNSNEKYCIYVTTGTPIPQPFNFVIPIEYVKYSYSSMKMVINSDYTLSVKDKFIRKIGDNISKGSLLISKGKIINECDVALLASVGIIEIQVIKNCLTIAMMSNGDELIDPFNVNEKRQNMEDFNNSSILNGKIYDSNKTYLTLLLKRHFKNIKLIDFEINEDTYDSVKETIESIKDCDLAISTGGVSMGEHDYVKKFFEEKNSIIFGRVNMKPGLPTMLAKYNDTLFFGLSGNPVSCVVGYYLFVKSLLSCYFKNDSINNKYVKSKILHDINSSSERTELVRAKTYFYNNELISEITGKNQLSSSLISLKDFNSLIILDSKSCKRNQIVDVIIVEDITFIDDVKYKKIIENNINTQTTLKGCCNCGKKESKQIKINDLNESEFKSKLSNNNFLIEKDISINDNNKPKIGLLIISDKLLINIYEKNLVLENFEFLSKKYSNDFSFKLDSIIVPNNKQSITDEINRLTSNNELNVLLTSGGTGVSSKDMTSETVENLVDRKCNGLSSFIQNKCLDITIYSVLSNIICGIKNKTLIITCPGNPKALIEVFDIISPVLNHFINQINSIEDFH